MPFRHILLRGVIYGALAAVAIAVAFGIGVFVDELLRWRGSGGQFRYIVESAALVAAFGGALASLPGAVGGIIIAMIVRLLDRWPKVATGAAVLTGAVLAGSAGFVVMAFGFAYHPEVELTIGYWAVYVGLPGAGGAVLGWLLARGPATIRVLI